MWNDWEEVQEYKNTYKPGMRVECLHMEDKNSIPSGAFGTIKFVDDAGQIHVAWDNGRGIALIPGVDTFEVRLQIEKETLQVGKSDKETIKVSYER